VRLPVGCVERAAYDVGGRAMMVRRVDERAPHEAAAVDDERCRNRAQRPAAFEQPVALGNDKRGIVEEDEVAPVVIAREQRKQAPRWRTPVATNREQCDVPPASQQLAQMEEMHDTADARDAAVEGQHYRPPRMAVGEP
jgi:hypothetical protein